MITRIKRHASEIGQKADFVQVMYLNFDSSKGSAPTLGRRIYRETTPKQKKLNEKRARRYFEALVEANFQGGRDLHVTLTFRPEDYPESEQAAKRQVARYIENLNRKRKRRGIENVKYIIVFEVSKTGRYHFHILMDGKLSRDEVEKTWRKGYCNADRLRADKRDGLQAIIKYLSKGGAAETSELNLEEGQRGKWSKRWIPSRGLVRPWITCGKSKISRSRFEKILALPEDCEEFTRAIERDNPGYQLRDVEKSYCKETGSWYLFCRMRRTERKQTEKAANRK